MLCTRIFDLCVCLTTMVEWYKAQVDPGSQPVTLTLLFFFVSFYLSFLSFFATLRVILYRFCLGNDLHSLGLFIYTVAILDLNDR